MREKIKERWINALTSGEYQQASGCLKITSDKSPISNGTMSFCCLGVLCDLYSQEVGVEWDKKPDGPWQFFGHKDYLPDDVMTWAELEEEDPYIESEDATLSELNDNVYSFDEIAELIKDEL